MTTTCNLPIDILTMIGDFSGLEFSTQEYKRKSNYKKGYKINKMVKNCDLCKSHDHKIKTYYKTDRFLFRDYVNKSYLSYLEQSEICDDCLIKKRKFGNLKVSLINPKFIEEAKKYSAFSERVKPIKKIQFHYLIIRQEIAKAELSDGEDKMVKITNSFILKSKVDKFFGINK